MLAASLRKMRTSPMNPVMHGHEAQNCILLYSNLVNIFLVIHTASQKGHILLGNLYIGTCRPKYLPHGNPSQGGRGVSQSTGWLGELHVTPNQHGELHSKRSQLGLSLGKMAKFRQVLSHPRS